RICQLVLKAIELIPTGGGDELPPETDSGPDDGPRCSWRPWRRRTARRGPVLSKSGTLSGPDIVSRLQLPLGHQQRLSVIPFKKGAVKAASLDVRLGDWFVIARRTRL